jgi:hypothetical protein
MKITAWILLAVLILAGTAAGQDSTAGIKVGPMLCISGDQETSSIYNPSNLFGLKVGLFYARKISPVFTLQPEVHLALKGSGYYSVVTRHEESVHFNYLEIPLLVNARLAGDMLELFAGPYGAFLLSHTPLDEEHDWTWEENELKGYDFGACVGVRAWWRDVSLELQFLRGFINVLPSYNRSHYNTAVVFQVGYRLFK